MQHQRLYCDLRTHLLPRTDGGVLMRQGFLQHGALAKAYRLRFQKRLYVTKSPSLLDAAIVSQKSGDLDKGGSSRIDSSKKEAERHQKNIQALYERSDYHAVIIITIAIMPCIPHRPATILPRDGTDYFALLKSLGRGKSDAATQPPPKPQPLVLKRLKDSYCEMYMPFKDDLSLREEYVNCNGQMRLGKILEDLDRLAGAIAYKHASDQSGNPAPVTIVTAAVDRIYLLSKLTMDRNYKISGMVTYTGYSSLEVFMSLEAVYNNTMDNEPEATEKVLSARFTMVARDNYTGKSAQVNPLMLENDEERRLFKISEKIKEYKKGNAQKALAKLPPSPEERILIHNMWIECNKFVEGPYNTSVPLPKDMAWLDETTMESVTLCFPQDRNIHNKIFGGYLMRLAHELAFANACVFTRGRPTYVSLDDFSFRSPVNIGSILKLTSQVVYSEPEGDKTFQISVKVDVIDNKDSSVHTTNTFYFTFHAPDNGSLKRIMPRTYSDMMKYLEGRRRREIGRHIKSIETTN
ncbi:hypothetical protein H4219_000526 [Mycoemilia scoparia]|uniref:HotDog ACOT-type domain-containing protein n=1 Tax=Mycoemilia scoparia TaxID=417184 RepID=A0A9W8DX07_9FUNG|nr:hypothetical protein H4219_000526 [Mycoemilia scoparia]